MRRLMEATQDLPATLECLHPDVEWIPARAPTEGTYRGHAGVARFFSDTMENFVTFEPHFELQALSALPSAGIFDVRNGQVMRWRDYGSRERALEASRRAGSYRRRSS